MNQAQLNDMVEQATEQERRQHKQWQNWYLGSKLSKIKARAIREAEAGITETEIEQERERGKK